MGGKRQVGDFPDIVVEPLSEIVEVKKEVVKTDVFQVQEEALPTNFPPLPVKRLEQQEAPQAEAQGQGKELGQARRPTIGEQLVEGVKEAVEGAKNLAGT